MIEQEEDEWRDQMLFELLQLLGWYKMVIPNPEQFRQLVAATADVTRPHCHKCEAPLDVGPAGFAICPNCDYPDNAQPRILR